MRNPVTCKHRRISRLLSIHANTYKMIALSFARQQARVCTGFRVLMKITFMTSPVIHRDRSLPRTLLPGSTYPQDDWHVLTKELDKENVPYAVISHVTPAEIVI